jgi:uncharacterized protein
LYIYEAISLSFEQNIYITYFISFSKAIFKLFNQMFLGIFIGIFFISLLNVVPQEAVLSVLGNNNGLKGILRATLAGLLLDLCSHGILVVGAKLYERGVSLGQVLAFLIASPWNSLSLTFILFSLIGLSWTLVFIFLSALIAIISGLIFNNLVERKILPSNPNQIVVNKNFQLWPSLKTTFNQNFWTLSNLQKVFWQGIKESRMVVRWLLFGIIVAALLRTFLPDTSFAHYFGKNWLGLSLTIVFATILEVCSEGSTPIAADILNRASAPGNAFAFLMTGVSTDYSEILILRESTKSWKIAFFLPLITLPQILLLAFMLNQ